MALLDRPRVAQLVEAAEETFGFGIRSRSTLERAEVVEREFSALASAAEDLALHSMDYMGGRPQELSHERRRRIAQRSRVALKFDPLAGAEAGLLADFAFGKGVPVPTARDPRVQEVIDEAWCHDEGTQALTAEGWLGYRELRARWEAGDAPAVAQFDMGSGEITFAEPLAMAATRYEGEMVRVESRRGPSFVVTPEHRMVTRRTAMGRGEWVIRRAHEMRSQEYVPVAAVAPGVRVEEFVLPGVLKRERSAKRAAGDGASAVVTWRKARHAPVSVPMDAWLEWLGWYIAEGSLVKPTVCQRLDSPRLAALVRACAALGVQGRSWTRGGRMWEWAPTPNKQFRAWLREHVGARDLDKRIPAFVFALAPEQREKLLDGLMGGDGTPTDWRERGKGAYYTSSERLADDVQRLATLCGWRATISVLPVRGKATVPERVVYLSRRAEKIVKRPERVPYAGDVWCFRMPLGTMVTRRDGTVLISGNTDANNEEKLTGFMAQRKLSNELLTSGELFVTLYEAGGKVRVGRLDPDTVEAVVPDPEDRLRPLWYMVHRRRYRWDFENDAFKPEVLEVEQGKPKYRYYEHWRNVEDARREREQGIVDADEDTLEEPPEGRVAKGKVFHLAINQTGEELRGNPPWARSLRFMSAMNTLTEAHVVMAQAASTFIAKRTVDGSPRQVTKAAASVLSHVSELGAGRMGAAASEERAFAAGQQGPPSPGSWWTESSTSKLESLALQSGAGQMVQTAQIVRAPISAAAGFGQHYLGDASNANLATASSLELPANMRVESWQEAFAQLYRWFVDRAIEAAVKAGRFGGLDGFPEEGPIAEMRLHEAQDRAAMERRTKVDLSYEFAMPFPGRRQLPDVGSFVGAIATGMDPNGVNIPLRRALLRFAMEQTGMPDVARLVEEAIPEKGMPGGIGGEPLLTPSPTPVVPGEPGSGPGVSAPEGETPDGARSGAPTGEEHVFVPEGWRLDAASFADAVNGSLRELSGGWSSNGRA